MHNVQTKNLDKYIDNQIDSISSDYAPQHPPPPPNDYYDSPYKKNKKSKHHHEPLPPIQILGHTAPIKTSKTKPNKTKKKKNKTPKSKPKSKKNEKNKTDNNKNNNNNNTNFPHTYSKWLEQTKKPSSTRAMISGTTAYGGSTTPPPHHTNKTMFGYNNNNNNNDHTRSASPPNHTNKNGSYKNGNTDHQLHRNRNKPPLTDDIVKIEQEYRKKTIVGGYFNPPQPKPHNIKKAKKILGVDLESTFIHKPSQNRNGKIISLQLSNDNDNESMNKNNSNSICSIESLDADDGTGLINSRRVSLHNNNSDGETNSDSGQEGETEESNMDIESVDNTLSDSKHISKEEENNTNKKTKPKIRMWNALAYGLEDPVEGKTFEWVDSKYVRLLQLSTYSTVMGPKVKFVWKNSDSYNTHSINLQKQYGGKQYNESDHGSDDDDDEKNEDKSYKCNGNHNRTVRPEFAYHELEAWIAKQTLDCTGWKNKHNKTAPPPFTKKTMIASEFGVALCCIQFDSSLRALRNKQFTQYINGVYTHTPAQVNHHISQTPKGTGIKRQTHSAHTPKSTQTPNHRFMYNRNVRDMSNNNNHSSIAPTLSPYDHTGMTDTSPNHQIPSSYSQKSYSSRYSSPSSYRPVGDTLADYLSKFAPFSFSAGLSGGMNISGADIPQVPYNRALMNQKRRAVHNNMAHGHNAVNNNMHHIDDNEDPDDIGHYSLVLAVEYKYYEKFIDCLDAIEHWLYMIASQIRYLLALNKCFKCDQMEHSLKLHTDFNALHGGNTMGEIDNNLNDSLNDLSLGDEDNCPDRLHTIIPFMTNIAPSAIFKFDQLFSATFVGQNTYNMCGIDEEIDPPSVSMSYSYLMSDPRDGMIYNMNYIPSRGLPARISLFETWFTCTLDNRDKHKLSIMISSHLQTLGRTVIIGDDEQEIDRYISTLALFSTSQQRSLSRLSVKVDNPNNLSSHYIPELYLQGIIIPTIKAPVLPLNPNISSGQNNSSSNSINDANDSTSDKSKSKSHMHALYNTDTDYAATVAYLNSSPAIKQLQEDLYLAPGPSTLVLLTSSKHVIMEKDNNNNNNTEEKQSFWWIRQTAMPHKFKQEQQSMLFQKLFYLRRRSPKRRNSSSYIYARKRSGIFDSPSRKDIRDMHHKSNNPYLTPPHNKESPPNKHVHKSHHRTEQRKKQKEKEAKDLLLNSGQLSSEFTSMNKIYPKNVINKTLVEEYEHMESDDEAHGNDNDSVTNTSASVGIQSTQSSIPQPIHAPHLHVVQNGHKDLTFVEPSLSPMIATVVFGSFNIPQELKMTFLETQFRILLEKASEILLYIEHEQKDLLSFYDKTCHVMSCKEFKEQVPMEALYPQIMQKFESQLRSDLQISRQEDLYVLLSISEGFRPNLFSLMFGNPVFDIEVADILRYFLF